MKIRLKINNEEKEFEILPGDILLDVLRREGYTEVKRGCDTGDCGACAVIMDGIVVNSCLVFAARADGSSITTASGVGTQNNLHLLQKTFIEEGAVQCGFCTPGMIISAYNLLQNEPEPTIDEIKDAISGNLCRCTGYVKIINAIRKYSKMHKRNHKDKRKVAD